MLRIIVRVPGVSGGSQQNIRKEISLSTVWLIRNQGQDWGEKSDICNEGNYKMRIKRVIVF